MEGGSRLHRQRGVTASAVLSLLFASSAALTTPPAGPAQAAVSPSNRSELPNPAAPHQSASSLNWAGYVATGATFTDVVGSWVEPAVSCSGKAQYATFWIGVDGFISTDKNQVEQIGTDSDCTKGHGKHKPGGAAYFAWWDLYPQTVQQFSSASCPVNAGDSMQAEVTDSNGQFLLALNDVSQGWQCTASQTLSAPAVSAEWVVEAPFVLPRGHVLPLADFGSVTFSGVQADGQPISAFNNEAISMGTKKLVKAATSGLGGDGQSFTVTWQHT